MASPVGHSLAGYAVYSFLDRTGRKDRLLLAVFVAVAPDLDFIPGLLVGAPALYHQGVTHSIGFGLAVSLAIASGYRLKRRNFAPVFWLCFISYVSHLFIDFFGPDSRPPYGQPLLWPISDSYFMSPVTLLWGMRHASATDASRLEWLSGVFSLYNVGAILVEIIIILPFVLLGRWYRRVAIRPAL